MLPSNGDANVIPLLLAVPPQLEAKVKVFDERPAYMVGDVTAFFPLYAAMLEPAISNPATFRHTV